MPRRGPTNHRTSPGDDSKPAGGSVFDDLLGTERKRNRMKKRKKD
jgi:maltokinase